MTTLIVPALEADPWPTLGAQVCQFITQNLVFGPGDLRGLPAKLDAEKRALIYRAYEVYPANHPKAGRRRFRRVCFSLRKGTAKTELSAWLAAVELHPEGPVRCDGWRDGAPIGRPVVDPYIPLCAYTEEQTEDLAYHALFTILSEGPLRNDFDIGLERIMRVKGDGKAVAVASAPDARDGARTTFECFDEPMALDTPIATPTGWSTMGALVPGDLVFDQRGQPVPVVGASPVHRDRPCYRVALGDGTSVVTDASHRWRVYDKSPSYRREREVTTEMMHDLHWNATARFRLLPPVAVETPEVAGLPLHPYFLGLWLGDGDARNATISSAAPEIDETRQRLERLGYVVTRCAAKDRTPLLYVTTPDSKCGSNGDSAVGRLRKLGVLKNKHIPTAYLRGSREQRLALLQGLMDADGYVDPRGYCTFVNKNAKLIAGTTELLRTLGYRPTMTSSVDIRWPKPVEIRKLHFPSHPDNPPFQLRRKRARVRRVPTKSTRMQSIASVVSVASVPVRCIAVESDQHLFLAGEGMVPTYNTHRFTLARLKKAHRTMLANLPKRRASDAWALETTTAFATGENSVAEDTMSYARGIDTGETEDPQLFYFHRQASNDLDITTPEGLRAGVIEASGPAEEWSDIDGIVAQFQDPTADKALLERLWLNRPVSGGGRAFPAQRWAELLNGWATWVGRKEPADGRLITLGFDGSRFRDATAIIGTDVDTGYQWVVGIWERPELKDTGVEWEVDKEAVDAAMADAFERWEVWRLYADPPLWGSEIAAWSGRWGDKVVVEWWTNQYRKMAYALQDYRTAMINGVVSHDGNEAFARHIANACKQETNFRNEDTDEFMWLIRKERKDSPFKIDAAMAGCLSWQAREDAIASGAELEEPAGVFFA